MSEFEQKLEHLRALLSEHNLDALWLQRVSSFGWATCGASGYVNSAATTGAGSLLITPHAYYLITNNIERLRLEQEEHLAEQGWIFKTVRWHDTNPAVADLTSGLRLGSDLRSLNAVDLSNEMARLRASLTREEGERFRVLGKLCAEAMDTTIRGLRPGQSEFEISARLAQEAQARGVLAIVNLVATDDRVYAYRHPLATAKKLERYAMLVLVGRQRGLCCSITRLIHFGRQPEELEQKAKAVARVDATFIAATRPGRTLSQVFQRAVEAYADAGFADEWHLHHQGGPAGYEPREYLANPTSSDLVSVGQAYAWNPSITGTKSEDTILVGEESNEIITAVPGWPLLSIVVDGQTIGRPAILEV